MKFMASDPFLRQSKADKGWTVSFSVSEDEYDIIKELPKYQGNLLTITVDNGTQ